MEAILSIEEKNFKLKKDPESNRWYESDDVYGGYFGFEIKTTDQIIKIGIDNSQSCCEDWGCVTTNDDLASFIGARIVAISVTDKILMNTKIEALEYLDAGGVMFVNLETTIGLLQFVAYNAHNGYYGHDAVLVSKQLNKEIVL